MKNVVLLMLLSMLVSCSAKYTSNGESVYLKSRNGVNLQIPPPLVTSNISHFYDLPPQNQDAHVEILPPKINGASGAL